jgi:hypothetical protein
VTARTQTEIYRPFRGTLQPASSGSLALARVGIAAALKKKLPLVVLLAPPAIGAIIISFVVYARFSVEQGAAPEVLGGPSPASVIAAGFAKSMLQVRELIMYFHLATSVFSLLVIAWFGAGLIADDRRTGAHLLYFSRPLTVGGFLAAKFLTLFFFALLTVLLPSLVICTVATFASPDWAFLKEESRVVYASIGFGFLWAVVWSSVMLSISSLFARKTFALVASFAFFMLSGAIAVVLANLQDDDRYLALSLQGNFRRVAIWMFDMKPRGLDWAVEWSFAGLAATAVLAWTILVARARRMEASA